MAHSAFQTACGQCATRIREAPKRYVQDNCNYAPFWFERAGKPMSGDHRTLLIVFHTITGGTEQMAQAALRGAAIEPAVRVRLLRASEAGPDDVLTASGYIFATPETLASISGLMKDFFERTYYAVLDRINGRPYATMVCAGSDGQSACRQIERIATGWRLKQIAEPIIVCTRAQTPDEILAPKRITAEQLEPCVELGATLAAGLGLGMY